MEKEKKALEYRMGEVNANLKDAEQEAEKVGRSLLSKLEARICELEVEVTTSQMKTTETTKAHQKVERSIKELISLIEPIMILSMALIIGFIVISISSPSFKRRYMLNQILNWNPEMEFNLYDNLMRN